MVISRWAGISSSVGWPLASFFSTATCSLVSCGRNFETGSLRTSRPSSCSIMIATEVTGFVIE